MFIDLNNLDIDTALWIVRTHQIENEVSNSGGQVQFQIKWIFGYFSTQNFLVDNVSVRK